MDEGSSGEIPGENVFLQAEGCLADSLDQEEAGTISFSVNIPFGLTMMEARLEVVRGEVDLVLGTENPPSDYFGFGRGPGLQKILVDRDSSEPLMGRPWYVGLVSPFLIQEACEEGDAPDWRLSVRRSGGIEGRRLFEQEGQVAGSEIIPVAVPEDALSMEVSLESRQGDADLFVGIGDEAESLSSLNRGTGYEVAVIDPALCVPIRGETILLRLESWMGTADYRLEVTYTPGEVEPEAPMP